MLSPVVECLPVVGCGVRDGFAVVIVVVVCQRWRWFTVGVEQRYTAIACSDCCWFDHYLQDTLMLNSVSISAFPKHFLYQPLCCPLWYGLTIRDKSVAYLVSKLADYILHNPHRCHTSIHNVRYNELKFF